MAQYFDDFSANAEGPGLPVGFTERWNTSSNTFSVVADADAMGGKLFRAVKSGQSDTLVTMDAINPDLNTDTVEVLTRYRSLSFSSVSGGIALKSSGGNNTRNGLTFESGHNTSLRVIAFINNVFSVGATDSSFAPAYNTWNYYKAKFAAGVVYYKAWAGAIRDEPGIWNISYSETRIPGGGWAGMYPYGDTTHDYDFIGIGTNGDPAPTGPVPSGPKTPINLGFANLQPNSVRFTWEQG